MPDEIKTALRMMPYGFYSITSRHGQDVNAMVANWVVQVSFEPRMVALGLAKDAYSYGLIEKGGVFAVNIFRSEDQEAIKPFTKGRGKKPDKMETANYTLSPEIECPVLESAAAYLEFEVVDIFETGGDHNIVLGKAVGAGVKKPGGVEETLTLPDLGWSYAG